MLKGLVFLGNPGKQYAFTRHNLAWLVADELPGQAGLAWHNKFKGNYAVYRVNTTGCTVMLLKPGGYMNNAGESVLKFLHFFKFSPGEILIVHDDLELNFGTLDFKAAGGLGGHNGLRSVTSQLGSRDFYRFRLGISRPARGTVSSYVLGRFTEEETSLLSLYLKKAARCLEDILERDPEDALKDYHKVKTLE